MFIGKATTKIRVFKEKENFKRAKKKCGKKEKKKEILLIRKTGAAVTRGAP